MTGNHWSSTLLLLAILAVALPANGASESHFPLAGTVDSTGTFTLTGTLQGRASLHGVIYNSAWHNGTVTAAFAVQGARVQVVTDPILQVTTSRQNPIGNSEANAPLPEQMLEDFPFTGNVTILSEQTPATIEFRPYQADAQDLQLNLNGMQSVEIPPGFPHHLHEPVTLARAQAPFGRLHRDQPGPQSLAGAFLGITYGARVILDNGQLHREISTGFSPRSGLTADEPTVYTAGGVYDQTYVVIASPNAVTLQLHQDRGSLWNLLLGDFDGAIRGDMAFTDVTRTDVDARYSSRIGLVQAVGDFHMKGTYDGAGSHWRLNGTATFLGIDGLRVLGSRLGEGLAVVGGIGLVAWLTLAFTSLGRDLRLVVLGRNRAQALHHPTRVCMLRKIQESPGTTATQLAAEFGIRKTTLAFHIAILQKGGHIQVYQQGHRQHFAPLGVGATAKVSELHQVVLAHANHPLRGALLDILRDAGRPVAFRDLVAQIPHTSGRSGLSYHIHLMERQGVLERVPAGRQTFWAIRAQAMALLDARRALTGKPGGEAMPLQAEAGLLPQTNPRFASAASTQSAGSRGLT
ncbi:MAG: Helix-turn-helix domain [Thermoplasmata archaeon]|jgi:predicted transcriptional regulator|nr:Helix-turn-helix domain [Thermoplasmata archaeon]